MVLHAYEVFRVLGVSTRLRILELLKSEGPLPVKTIAERLGISDPAVSQHLKALRYAGLVTSERQGYWVPYSVDEQALEHCCGMLIDVCTCGERRGRPHAHRESRKPSLSSLVKMRQRLKRELEEVEKQLRELKAQHD